jgi:hypothetical protein
MPMESFGLTQRSIRNQKSDRNYWVNLLHFYCTDV